MHYLLPIARSDYRDDGGGYDEFGNLSGGIVGTVCPYQGSKEHIDSTSGKKHSNGSIFTIINDRYEAMQFLCMPISSLKLAINKVVRVHSAKSSQLGL